jgi:predicted Zn-dependent protease
MSTLPLRLGQLAPLALGLALLVAGAGLAAPRATTPSTDPLALPALLLSDGHLDRAAAELAALQPDGPGVDPARYHRLMGLVHLQRGEGPAAAASLRAALDLRPADTAPDPALCLSLARAELLAEAPDRALEALALGGAAAEALPGTPRVRAKAAHDLGRPAEALRALEDGARRFPTDRELVRQQVILLAELGLSQDALARAELLLADAAATPAEAASLAELLRRSGAPDRALLLLEGAMLRAPTDPDLRARAAAAHRALGQPLAAARALEPVAAADPTWADEVAELYREAGRTETALLWNGRVPDPKEKTRQRFAILLDGEEFERAAGLEERLDRVGLLRSDEALRYGLAYAHFRAGALEDADRLLVGMSDPKLFAQAAELRAAIARCADAPEGCA